MNMSNTVEVTVDDPAFVTWKKTITVTDVCFVLY